MADVRPIDANALAEDFLHDSKDAGFYRAIYEGAARRVQSAPILDYIPRQQWVSVKDRLPPHGFVLVWCEYTHSIEIAKYKGSLWRTQERRYALNSDWVTHWMPLPEPPKEETHEN